MNRCEEVLHLRKLFDLLDDAGKLKLVLRLRDTAIALLQPVMPKIPRAMSDQTRKAYQSKGISLEWDLTTTDAFEFGRSALSADLTKSQKSAASLLLSCTYALDKDAVSSDAQQYILDAYAGLGADDTETGRKVKRVLRANLKKAVAARTKYTEDEKRRWLELSAEISRSRRKGESGNLSKHGKAVNIAERMYGAEGEVPDSKKKKPAIERIRKYLGSVERLHGG